MQRGVLAETRDDEKQKHTQKHGDAAVPNDKAEHAVAFTAFCIRICKKRHQNGKLGKGRTARREDKKPLYGLVYAVIEKRHEIMRRDVRRDSEKNHPHAEHEQRENAYRGARDGFYTANGTIKCDAEHDKDDGKTRSDGVCSVDEQRQKKRKTENVHHYKIKRVNCGHRYRNTAAAVILCDLQKRCFRVAFVQHEKRQRKHRKVQKQPERRENTFNQIAAADGLHIDCDADDDT